MRGVHPNTWTLIWIWSLSQQKESWFLKQFAYPWRVEPYICGAWATISSLKRVISRLQVLDWFYCDIVKSSWTGALCIWLSVSRIVVLSFEWFLLHTFLVIVFFNSAKSRRRIFSLSQSTASISFHSSRQRSIGQLRYSAPLLCSDSSSLPSALVLTMLLINSFTNTHRKLC